MTADSTTTTKKVPPLRLKNIKKLQPTKLLNCYSVSPPDNKKQSDSEITQSPKISACFKNIMRGTFWTCGLPITDPKLLDQLGAKLLIYLKNQILTRIQRKPDLRELVTFLVENVSYETVFRILQAYYKFMSSMNYEKDFESQVGDEKTMIKYDRPGKKRKLADSDNYKPVSKSKKTTNPILESFTTVLSSPEHKNEKNQKLLISIKKFKYASNPNNSSSASINNFINTIDSLQQEHLEIQDKISQQIFEKSEKKYETWVNSRKINNFRMTKPESSSHEISVECLAFFFDQRENSKAGEKTISLSKEYETYFQFFKIIVHDIIVQTGLRIRRKLELENQLSLQMLLAGDNLVDDFKNSFFDEI